MKHLKWPLGSAFLLCLLVYLGDTLGLWSLPHLEKFWLAIAALILACIMIIGSMVVMVIIKLIDLAANKRGRG